MAAPTLPFLIYGSTGYTGALVAQAAVQRGLQPVLAGRDPQKVGRQAASLGLPWRSFDLNNERALRNALSDLGLILLLAGPYIETTRPVVEACLACGAHYLDITGELDVYQWLYSQDQAARAKGVMLGSGMGFDVVPTDCLAGYLQRKLPSANELTLAFASRGRGGWSRGTLRSGLGQLRDGLRVRRDGRLVQVPWGSKERMIDFGWGARRCSLFMWGDVVTAYHSTGIPNIEVYSRTSRSLYRGMRLLRLSARLLGWTTTLWIGQRMISWLPVANRAGYLPDPHSTASMSVWGQVVDPAGTRCTARLRTPEAYLFTAQSCLLAVEKILGGVVKPGYQTPTMAFGPDFVLEIAGVERQDL